MMEEKMLNKEKYFLLFIVILVIFFLIYGVIEDYSKQMMIFPLIVGTVVITLSLYNIKKS